MAQPYQPRQIALLVLLACVGLVIGAGLLFRQPPLVPKDAPAAQSPGSELPHVPAPAKAMKSDVRVAPNVVTGPKPRVGPSEQEASGVSAEYTGPRDVNILSLYKTFKTSLGYQARRIAELGEKKSLGREVTHAQHAAYVDLIQAQRFFYYSYQQRVGTRPKNTSNAVYHITGMGGLNVIFELTQDEFPDLFRLQKAALAEQAAQLGGK
jgi:hypothetical protein